MKLFHVLPSISFCDTHQLQYFLALRYRQATKEDISFMSRFDHDQSLNTKNGVYAADSLVPPKYQTSLKMINKRRQNGKNFVQHRVKPGPDPERQSETYWMTGIEMQIESEKPSKNWIEAGSGNLGKIFLEVLGCKNLPNLDFSPTGQDKTDAYVCVAHEDSIVNTSVISDSLNPLWMPWTQRAFIFNMIYPSSQIAVGVFDHDLICKHDPVGRVVINITNFCPNTSYIIKYDLTALIKGQRQTRASITLRIHVQFENERKALIAGMYPSETSLDLNVEEKQHFRTANYTVSNEVRKTSPSDRCEFSWFHTLTLSPLLKRSKILVCSGLKPLLHISMS